MSVKERVKEFIKFKGISERAFAEQIGASAGYVNAISKSIGAEFMRRILYNYPDLNEDWLLNGKGEMMKCGGDNARSSVIQNTLNLIPLLPVAAQGGSLNDFVESVEISKCEKMLCPVDGVDFAMTIKGDSMNPEYPNGSIIFIKRINERAFIEWGKVYVLDTCNGTVVKEIRKGDVESGVVCYSTNPDPKYQPFKVDFGDLYGMYRVVMCMSMK